MSNNTTLKNDLLFQLDAHLTRDFTDDFWGSLDAVWYYGAESTIGNLSGGELNDVGVGFTLGYQLTNNWLLTTGYTATVGGDSEDLDLGTFHLNFVYGWHELIEGIERLEDAQAKLDKRRFRNMIAQELDAEARAKDEQIADLRARLERVEAKMAEFTNSRTVAGR